MQYLSIENNQSPYLSFVEELYHSAFPLEERRNWEQLLKMIGTVPEMSFQVVLAEEKAIGFVISWKFDDWCFVEHLAVDPVNRGKKFGERIMKDFMTKNRKLLLEVEPPLSVDAVRRVGFYERLGLVCLPFDYLHPSYHDSHVSHSLVLMTNVPETGEIYFDEIILKVKRQVYLYRPI
ncbi:GNAT superfamily N-acetyltransferase [Pedobacter cryoconitis]|uniref:GNAT superfamily N-acetyltransferase n=1 Tax=Pedobacter cryoconitis TaxID=188932 RepID=A0A7W8ZHP2_9SPHI|nr:GNAT family N-acetyltransferase [Pedobacter cryoconitis]MBB5634227.1 GNAT superfamily N-acetyltransferase [Pedobacter cryoconitis]